MKNKHLTFEERICIEECLDKGLSIHRIANKLNRPDSSIVREVKRNRTIKALPTAKLCKGQHFIVLPHLSFS